VIILQIRILLSFLTPLAALGARVHRLVSGFAFVAEKGVAVDPRQEFLTV
jgi:hypothetical protein